MNVGAGPGSGLFIEGDLDPMKKKSDPHHCPYSRSPVRTRRLSSSPASGAPTRTPRTRTEASPLGSVAVVVHHVNQRSKWA